MTLADSLHEGGCTCGTIRYRMGGPLYVHCCHCNWCQRETGSAFVLNAMIEADRVEHFGQEPSCVLTPSASGKGQKIWRCPSCQVALWSNYSSAGDSVHFVRIGTLDEPARLPPDIHIFTASRQPWVLIPPDQTAVPQYYERDEHWPSASLERLRRLRGRRIDR